MRVLLVNKFWHPKGGSERYAFLLKDLLESKGHEVVTFGAEGAQHPLRYLWDRVAARRMSALLDEAKPDVAHLQNFTHQISPSILPVLRRRGVPIVWTLHDLDVFRPGYRNPNAWGRRATAWVEYVFHHTILNVYRRNIDCIIAPSRFVADAVRGWGWRGKIEVIPNFLPSPPRSLRTPSNSPSGRGGETPPVLFVGRLSEEKGIADFVEAARRLPEIPFEVVGNGNSSSPPLTLRGGNIRWLGVLQPDEAQRRIASAAVVVVPSVVPEIAPYVILEAMAAGVPVVASRIGGIPELVHEGETGFLVPPRDPAALAKTIEMVYGDGMLRERLGTRARAIATAEYGPERHYERIIGLFTALCTTRGS